MSDPRSNELHENETVRGHSNGTRPAPDTDHHEQNQLRLNVWKCRRYGRNALFTLCALYTISTVETIIPSKTDHAQRTASIPLRRQIERHEQSLMKVVNAMRSRGEASREFAQLRTLLPRLDRVRCDERGNVFFSYGDISMADAGIVHSDTRLEGTTLQSREQISTKRSHEHVTTHRLYENWCYFIRF